MFNPNHLHYADTRTNDLQREAARRRLAHDATGAADPANRMLRRLMTALGQQMIASGGALLERSEAEQADAPDWVTIRRVLS